ncbi:MAG: penicillin acylase family protein [Candidatus Marinimicrobia bacterium]|nr:penicillin acylase family protein [Candidatus Neomarinimicrobiota bacterium]
MLASVLKWAFIKYNRKALNSHFYNGDEKLTGIQNPASVFSDNWMIPHIYAKNKEDLFFSQGFVHARDRMWQMEMNRRIGMGELAEAFGEDALPTDKLTRTLGFARLAKKDFKLMDDTYKRYLECYSNGVNAFLQQKKLPIEFLLSGIKPKPWEPIHSLSWGRVMAWTLSHGWAGAIVRGEIVQKVGEEMATELGILYPDDNPVQLPDGIEFHLLDEDELYKAAAGPFLSKDMEGGGRGSNAWAITGSRTQSGLPLLCNDTHLILTKPGIWYLNHLFSEDQFHVSGASLAGIPGCMIGHNDHIAWGITLAFTDCEDIFIERVDPADSTQYQHKDGFSKFKIFKEQIYVKKSDPITITVKYAQHGPVIGEAIGHQNHLISLCSMSLLPNRLVEGFLSICTSENWDDFSKAIHLIEAPQLNVIYADIKGNIGHRITGLVPIRNQGTGEIPCNGWSGEFDWISAIPSEKMPFTFNPISGLAISTNNKPIGDDYPYYLGNSFMNGYRAKRITELLNRVGKIDGDYCESIMSDVESIPGRILVEGLIRQFKSSRPKSQKLIEVLLSWDFQLTTDSIGGTAYEVFLYHCLKNLLEPKLGTDLTHRYLGKGEVPLLLPVNELLGHSSTALFTMLQNGNSKWLNDTKEVIELIDKSLESACNWLETNVGFEQETWQWGDIHKVVFRHSMSIKKPLDKVFDSAEYSMKGDTDTVCQSAFNPATPFHATEWCPSFRMVVDLSDFRKTKMLAPPGQSGILGSKHYGDQEESWFNHKFITMLWDKKDVVASCKDRLDISPK